MTTHCGVLQAHRDELPDLRVVLVMDDCPVDGVFSLSLGPIFTEPMPAAEEEAVRAKAEDAVAGRALQSSTTLPATTVACAAHCSIKVRNSLPCNPWPSGSRSIATILVFQRPICSASCPCCTPRCTTSCRGVPNAIAPGAETSFEDLQRISPTVTLTSPYEFEHIFLHIMQTIEEMPRAARTCSVGRWRSASSTMPTGLAASAELRESYRRADMTFFSNIRGSMGGRLLRLYSAGAPLLDPWRDFAEAIGLLPLEVYSLTQAGGCPAASRRRAQCRGSCGRITPGFQIRIADDGEVLVRGETVMLGLWNAPDADCGSP